MQGKAKRRIKRTLIGLVTFYLTSGTALYLLQDLLFFHPKKLPSSHRFTFPHPFTELNIPVGDRNLNVVQFKAANTKGIVLYFHGNMRNIERYANQAPLFTQHGYDVWMVDYPGFGKSTGKRTEETMYADAQLLYNIALKEVPAEDIVIYGRSIGTGVASYLAAHQPCQQLVLETPYYSIEAIARYYAPIFPVKSLMHYRFPINEYLPRVKAPITILHGTRDEVIPYRQAKRLASIKEVALITIPKGKHNNLSDYPLFQQTIARLLTH
jgi:alpha-beta hydrolase superfamily lysophospholipase